MTPGPAHIQRQVDQGFKPLDVGWQQVVERVDSRHFFAHGFSFGLVSY
jgi:hypothetical protein